MLSHVKITLRTFLVIFPILMCFNTSLAMTTENDSTINKAILLKLSITNNALPIEVLQLQKKMTAEIAKADYGNALVMVISGLEKYPNNFLLQTYLAMILGDYTQ